MIGLGAGAVSLRLWEPRVEGLGWEAEQSVPSEGMEGGRVSGTRVRGMGHREARG